jgi:hypothetical protein
LNADEPLLERLFQCIPQHRAERRKIDSHLRNEIRIPGDVLQQGAYPAVELKLRLFPGLFVLRFGEEKPKMRVE